MTAEDAFRAAPADPKLRALGIEAGPEDIFQLDGFCETYLATIGWPTMESLEFTDMEGN